MEQKLVRVPFDIELAKKITNKEIEGRIVTRDGGNARILCFDANGRFPIVALIDGEDGEIPVSYTSNGLYQINETPKLGCDLMLEIPEYMTFKDGDIIACGWEGQNEGSAWVSIVKSIRVLKNDIHTNDYVFLMLKSNNNTEGKLVFEGYTTSGEWIRKATESEKQKLIDALKASKVPRAKEYLKRFFGIEEKKEYEFKPKDWCLCRSGDEWCLCRFSHKTMRFDGVLMYVTVGGIAYEKCIPYNEQTAHLVGKRENWEDK